MVKVTCQIEECSDKRKSDILVHNHWNERAKIILEINGEKYVVFGNELTEAVKNCMNTSKY